MPYWMDYNNQLVATGELNDVGAIVRTNVKDSYRAESSSTDRIHLRRICMLEQRLH
ncbi:MAG: hypothetical protein R3B47_08935 [Bacteroidia bacterium]